MTSMESRFWSKVNQNGPMPLHKAHRANLGPCWQWTDSLVTAGYGTLGFGHCGYVRAHRFAYKLLVAPIPDGFYIDHLCRNRGCVNPKHLEPVTHAENVRRGIAGQLLRDRMRSLTHCREGHELAGDNLRYDAAGKRICIQCKRETLRRSRASKDQGGPVTCPDCPRGFQNARGLRVHRLRSHAFVPVGSTA